MIASMGYDRNAAIEKTISKNRKAFTVRLNMSVNSKAPNVIKKLTKEFLRAFRDIHESEKKARGMKVNLLLTSNNYTMIDFSKYSGALHEVRGALEKIGMPIDGFIYRYEKASDGCQDEWIFDVTFYDVDPTDPMTGTTAWELYR